jgi:hypothetical protein
MISNYLYNLRGVYEHQTLGFEPNFGCANCHPSSKARQAIQYADSHQGQPASSCWLLVLRHSSCTKQCNQQTNHTPHVLVGLSLQPGRGETRTVCLAKIWSSLHKHHLHALAPEVTMTEKSMPKLAPTCNGGKPIMRLLVLCATLALIQFQPGDGWCVEGDNQACVFHVRSPSTPDAIPRS